MQNILINTHSLMAGVRLVGGVPKLSEIDAPGKPEEMYRDENGAICYNQQKERCINGLNERLNCSQF